MSSSLKKTIALGATTLLAAGAALPAVAATAEQGGAPETASALEAAADDARGQTAVVYLSEVSGTLSFTQEEVASNEEIGKYLGDASRYLCGSEAINREGTAAEDWAIRVGGAVDNPLEVTYGQLATSDEIKSIVMGCACAGNPVDGRAAVNAAVTGVPLGVILEQAQPAPGANTIVFTSDDGYAVALPLDYVATHLGMLVFDVNGAPLANSIGGTNQLWMGGTSANYFARDIESITIEARDKAPLSPTSDEARAAYQNLPSIGILYGGDVR